MKSKDLTLNCSVINNNKEKIFLKDIHIDFPSLDMFKEMPEIRFILGCIFALEPSFKYITEKQNQNNEVQGAYISVNNKELERMWGIELRPCNIEGHQMQTSIFYKTVVSEKIKNCDKVLTEYMLNTFLIIKNNLEMFINGLDNEEEKKSIDKEGFDILLDKIIDNLKGE